MAGWMRFFSLVNCVAAPSAYCFNHAAYWQSAFGIGTDEAIRVGGPRHVSHEI
jgi:hypothetical protein